MSKRRYHQHCGLARALDVVGTRWTLLIVRNLLLGPLRFTDLQQSLPGITPNLLSDRLKELEAKGLVQRVRTPPPASVDAYALTERGAALEPAIHELGRWGWPYMANRRPEDHIDPAWGMLALKRRYRSGHGAGVIALELDDTPFVVAFGEGGVTIRRGEAPEADARVRAAWPAIAGVFYGGRSLSDGASAGEVSVEGSPEILAGFAEAFGLIA